MSDVTRLLDAAAAGDRKAAADLLPLVYDELRKLAAARMAAESPDQTLQPTALVHEAYLRLVGPADETRWDNRGHFFAAAAEAMRRILVDAAGTKRPEARRRPLDRVELPGPGRNPRPRTSLARPGRGPRPARRRGPGRRGGQAPLLRRADARGGRRRPRPISARRPTATGPTPGPGSGDAVSEAEPDENSCRIP